MTMAKNALDYSILPPHIQDGFRVYIERHVLPGSFVRACLENNLRDAFGKADEINRERLCDIVQFLYNEAPNDCWGSREKVQVWISKRVP